MSGRACRRGRKCEDPSRGCRGLSWLLHRRGGDKERAAFREKQHPPNHQRPLLACEDVVSASAPLYQRDPALVVHLIPFLPEQCGRGSGIHGLVGSEKGNRVGVCARSEQAWGDAEHRR